MENEQDKYYTIEQLAGMWQVSTRTIIRLIEKKELKAFKIGRIWRITQTDIDEYIKSHNQ